MRRNDGRSASLNLRRFVRIYDRMAKLDMMNQLVTHVGGAVFACPGGVAPARFIGQRLFEGA